MFYTGDLIDFIDWLEMTDGFSGYVSEEVGLQTEFTYVV